MQVYGLVGQTEEGILWPEAQLFKHCSRQLSILHFNIQSLCNKSTVKSIISLLAFYHENNEKKMRELKNILSLFHSDSEWEK